MATKLRNLKLTSVDMVRAGANQEADILLYKSAYPQEGSELPTEQEKNIFKQFIGWLRKNAPEGINKPSDTIEKDYSTFNSISENRDKEEKLWRYTSALTDSIRSIMVDNELDSSSKCELMKKSLAQFDKAMGELIETLCQAQTVDDNYDYIEEVEVQKYNSFHGPDGRFASAPGGAVGGISQRTITGGGISIHTKSGKEPKSGYMCATYTDRSQWLKGDDVTNPEKRTAAIKSFMEKNKDVLSDPDNYLGTWYDTSTGNISLDISRNFTDKNAAIKFASEHNEKAIWDVKNMAEIPTGGTGNNI
jgi:hypothetical protein